MSLNSRELTQRAKNRYLQEKGDVDEHVDEKLLMDAWWPIVKEMGLPGRYSGEELVRRLGKFGALKLVLLAMHGKQERVQAFAAKELAWMGGLKPVDKSASVNLNIMTEGEIDSLLETKLEEIYGIKLGDVKREEGVIEGVVGEGEDVKVSKD